MTIEPELDRLILLNMSDLDATAKRIDALQSEIWREMREHVTVWAERVRWNALEVFDDPSAAPPEWVEDGSPLAWFEVDWGPRDNETGGEGQAYFRLSRLAGVEGGQTCLWLKFTRLKRSAWKGVFRSAASTEALGGFLFDDVDGFYLDCTPPAGTLSEAVAEKDYTSAFAPLDRALDAAYAAWPAFDKLLRDVRA